MISIIIRILCLALLAAFVFGLAWILDDLVPQEMRDWSTEDLEDDEPSKGDAP